MCIWKGLKKINPLDDKPWRLCLSSMHQQKRFFEWMCVNSTSFVRRHAVYLLPSSLSCVSLSGPPSERWFAGDTPECCRLTDGIIRSSVSHGIPHPGRCFPVHSPICLFPAKSFSSFFTYCVFTALPCMRPWIPAGISHAEVRTLAFVRTVTAGLNKTSFHPFIFNRKTQNGLEVFANTSLQQVISYCAVLRLPPRGQAVVKILSPSFRLLSVCSSPHRTSSCSCQIWGSA